MTVWDVANQIAMVVGYAVLGILALAAVPGIIVTLRWAGVKALNLALDWSLRKRHPRGIRRWTLWAASALFTLRHRRDWRRREVLAFCWDWRQLATGKRRRLRYSAARRRCRRLRTEPRCPEN